MVSITANEAVEAAFLGVSQRVEVRNSSGKLIGYFEPSEEMRRLYDEARKHIDPAEIERRKKYNGPGYTTQEVLEHLRTLKDS